MAIIITDECINCGACEPECPNTAIYEGGVEWKWSDGTDLEEVEMEDGSKADGNQTQEAVSDEFYYIVAGKCTECTGFHENPSARRSVQLIVVYLTLTMRNGRRACSPKRWLHLYKKAA